MLAVLGGAWLWLRDSSLVAVDQRHRHRRERPRRPAVREALADAARDMTTLHVRQDELRTAVDPYPAVLRVYHRRRLPARPADRRPRAQRRSARSSPAAARPRRGRRDAHAHHAERGLPAIAAKALPPGGSRSSDRARRRAVALLAAAPARLRARVQRVYVGDRGWTLPLRDGPILYFGGSDALQAKWAAAARVLADPTSTGATYLDVRLPERPAAGGLEPRPSRRRAADVADGPRPDQLPDDATGADHDLTLYFRSRVARTRISCKT